MDKRPMGYVPGKGNPLDKKVPKSTKYQHVESTIKSGNTVRDIEVVSNQSIAKRKGELFKRIKITTLYNLLKLDPAQESIYDLKNRHDAAEAAEESKFTPKAYYQQQEDNQSMYSRAPSNISQQSEVSKFSAVTYATQQLGITDQTTFILLDLRDIEDFLLYHIKEAINFPAHWLARDKTIPQLYRFDPQKQKNQEGKLIIIYAFDEKHGMPTAQLFAEKGFENVFLLSGGIETFLQAYPECVEGTKVPVLPQKNQTQGKILMRSNYKEESDKKSVNFVRAPESMSQMSDMKDSRSQISKTTKKSTITRRNLSNQR